MTAKQMSAMIGKSVVVLWGNSGEIQFECRVTDARWWSTADKLEYWLEPVSGGGRMWVDADLCNPVVPSRPVVLTDAQQESRPARTATAGTGGKEAVCTRLRRK